MTEKTLLLVAHAPSPNTRALFDAAVAGACDPAINHVRVAAHSPFEVTAEMVLGADALLLGTPENLGYMSGALKDFFDRIYNPCLADPIICRGEFSEHFAPRCRELAMTLAVGLESGIF
jgi:NAD(P)H-dependent FMN reductase